MLYQFIYKSSVQKQVDYFYRVRSCYTFLLKTPLRAVCFGSNNRRFTSDTTRAFDQLSFLINFILKQTRGAMKFKAM